MMSASSSHPAAEDAAPAGLAQVAAAAPGQTTAVRLEGQGPVVLGIDWGRDERTVVYIPGLRFGRLGFGLGGGLS